MQENEFYHLLNKEKRIVVYGAGKAARAVIHVLENTYGVEIWKVIVSDTSCNPKSLEAHQVVSATDISRVQDKVQVIVATMENKQSDIISQLTQLGFQDYVSIDDELYHYITNQIRYIKRSGIRKEYRNHYIDTYMDICADKESDPKVLSDMLEEEIAAFDSGKACMTRLVVVLGTKCSLRCRDCNNLIPMFKPQKDLDAYMIIESLQVMLGKLHRLLVCEVIGGEPFLSKNLQKVLEFVISQEKVCKVEITTNGMIMPEQQLFPLLKNNKTKVRISNYGNVVNNEKLVSFLDKEEIAYERLDFSAWICPGDVESRAHSEMELKFIYKNCLSSLVCKTLFGDKLFSCARAASLWELGAADDIEYIDINENLKQEQIVQFLTLDFSNACNYCDTGVLRPTYTEPAVQL